MTHTTDTCSYCQKAEHEADYPLYRASCRGCGIRGLAQSPWFHKAGVSGRLDMSDPYAKALGQIFGTEWREARALVKAEHERNRNLRVIL